MKGKDGDLAFTEQHRKIIFTEQDRKNQMERVMNKENKWDQITYVDVVEGPTEKVTVEEVMTA